jgi:DNA-binding XRE family transcriptional regulator
VIGPSIMGRRVGKGWTRNQLALMAGVSYQTIAAIETGRTNSSAETREAIAAALERDDPPKHRVRKDRAKRGPAAMFCDLIRVLGMRWACELLGLTKAEVMDYAEGRVEMDDDLCAFVRAQLDAATRTEREQDVWDVRVPFRQPRGGQLSEAYSWGQP